MKQPTHFIEVIKFTDGITANTSPSVIKILEWALQISKKKNIETIAVFKIYSKQ